MAEEITTNTLWNLLREIGSLSFSSNQSSSAHARPISEATYLVLWLKFPLSIPLTWVNGSDDTARMLNYLQTVETLIRRRVPRRLIWVCTVCQSPFYGSPDYNGLNIQTPLSFNHTLPKIEQVYSTIFRSKNYWRNGDRVWHFLESCVCRQFTRKVNPWFQGKRRKTYFKWLLFQQAKD